MFESKKLDNYSYYYLLAACTRRCPGVKYLLRFSDSFSSREPMVMIETSDHSETISNRFLMSKLVYRMFFDQFATFSIFGLFLIKGTDDQEREV